jgi:hypothetical protein
MDHRAMLALADRYVVLLEANGALTKKADLERCFDASADRMILLCHARFQLELARRVIDRVGGQATAIRLLGCAQGLLIAAGLVTIGDVWRENRTWLDGVSTLALNAVMAELDGKG